MKYKFKEINKVQKINFIGEVLDLSIDEDNSYCVNDKIVHNCGCLTTKQTTIGYPAASLIRECYEIKVDNNYSTKIVADGGMKDFSDIILALALGADYVMVGSILNKSLESCADTYWFKRIKINQYSKFAKWLFKKKFKLTKKFRGMSTKEVQKKWGKKILKTSEGISKKQNVEYTLKQWTENFDDYLRSTMSYTNSKNLSDFIGKVNVIKISDKAYDRFNK
jgi:NAD(P)H-dependent flavin oxidoreductase YrpB (nitropropane dioxygenase family)